MKKIDCLGEICPMPVIRLQKELSRIKKGEAVLVVTDHSCSYKSIEEFCYSHDLSLHSDEAIPGVWEILITSK